MLRLYLMCLEFFDDVLMAESFGCFVGDGARVGYLFK